LQVAAVDLVAEETAATAVDWSMARLAAAEETFLPVAFPKLIDSAFAFAGSLVEPPNYEDRAETSPVLVHIHDVGPPDEEIGWAIVSFRSLNYSGSKATNPPLLTVFIVLACLLHHSRSNNQPAF
jgi:hypothetical protein